jgi:hypothetical protein
MDEPPEPSRSDAVTVFARCNPGEDSFSLSQLLLGQMCLRPDCTASAHQVNNTIGQTLRILTASFVATIVAGTKPSDPLEGVCLKPLHTPLAGRA